MSEPQKQVEGVEVVEDLCELNRRSYLEMLTEEAQHLSCDNAADREELAKRIADRHHRIETYGW